MHRVAAATVTGGLLVGVVVEPDVGVAADGGGGEADAAVALVVEEVHHQPGVVFRHGVVAVAAHHGGVAGITGQTFVLLGLAVTAAEVAVGLGICILVYRQHGNVDVRKPGLMKW